MIAPRPNRPVAILGGIRTPFCKAGTSFATLSAVDLMGDALRELVQRYDLRDKTVGEVALGTVFYHPATWNFAREAVFKSGLLPSSPAMAVQRACATSLDAAIVIAQKVASGQIDVGIAGGSESLSNVAMYLEPQFARRVGKAKAAKTWGDKLKAFQGFLPSEISPKVPPVVEATTRMNMGQHCERMAKEWKISRQAQDELALASHRNAAEAYERGFFSDLIAPCHGADRDNVVRGDTSLERLAKLKTVFDPGPEGTLTAGNSSPLTDGAGCVLLASEAWAKEHRFPVRAWITDFESAAVDIKTEGLLMAPAYAAPKMLKRNNMKLQDFDYYEIHEAFAAQVLCTLKAWESDEFCKKRLGIEGALGSIDRKKMNTVGGSVALGHPFGATGARLLTAATKMLDQKGSGKAFLSICTGGGMGTVAILER